MAAAVSTGVLASEQRDQLRHGFRLSRVRSTVLGRGAGNLSAGTRASA
jgi:hypothetical protein